MASKPQPKKPEAKPAEASAPRPPPRQHTQEVRGTPSQQQPRPLPRPLFGRVRGSDALTPAPTREVLNALQQTVRSQAVLIRNYQELLRLTPPEEEPPDEADAADEGQAA
jgi:hypothetical protein